MTIFKQGDKVMVSKPCSKSVPNVIYTLKFVYLFNGLMASSDKFNGCGCEDNWILVPSKWTVSLTKPKQGGVPC